MLESMRTCGEVEAPAHPMRSIMLSRFACPPIRLLWLLAASFAATSPIVARADCGGHDRPAIPGSVVGLDHRGLEPASIPGRRPDPADSPRPCSGPNCSRRGEAPTPAPTSTIPRILPERGLLASWVRPARAIASRSALAHPQPTYDPPSLDRPDRPPRP